MTEPKMRDWLMVTNAPRPDWRARVAWQRAHNLSRLSWAWKVGDVVRTKGGSRVVVDLLAEWQATVADEPVYALQRLQHGIPVGQIMSVRQRSILGRSRARIEGVPIPSQAAVEDLDLLTG